MKQKILVLIVAVVLNGCAYDLDVTGFFRTSVPVQDRFLGSLEWTATNGEYELKADTTSYSLLIAGDAHVGTVLNLETMLQRAVAQGALAIAIAGDVTTGRVEHMVRTDSLFRVYPEIEKYTVPGNHDLYFEGWKTYYELFGPSAYIVKIRSGEAQDLYIFLDSGSGTLGTDQLTWLKSVLEEERTSFRYTIVVTHLNFFRNRFTGSTNPVNEELLMLLDLFTENNVQLVIQGHDHKRHETSLGATTYLTLDALKDGVQNASYLELRVDEEGIQTVFHAF
jgi:predicted phosphodiesterase